MQRHVNHKVSNQTQQGTEKISKCLGNEITLITNRHLYFICKSILKYILNKLEGKSASTILKAWYMKTNKTNMQRKKMVCSFLCGGCLLFAPFVSIFRTSPYHELRVMQTEKKVIFSCYCWLYFFMTGYTRYPS